MQDLFGGGGSMSSSMVSRDDNAAAMSSEDSSSPDDSELELGLGLSLGCGFKTQQQQQSVINKGQQQYARFLTAKDLPSVVSPPPSSLPLPPPSSSTSSASSTSRRSNNGTTSGTKRSADSATNGASSQVVGWPPIRAYRMNSMVNQAKSMATEEYNSMIGKNKSHNTVVENANNGSNIKNGNSKSRTSLFVKVNMDGIAIGRKVDLSSHGSYEKLAHTLEDMFLRPTPIISAIRSSAPTDVTRCPKLLDGSSDFVLTYEDKDGDWMLVGDVPWGMFLGSVKRLKIMRTSEATGLAPGLQERDGRQQRKHI